MKYSLKFCKLYNRRNFRIRIFNRINDVYMPHIFNIIFCRNAGVYTVNEMLIHAMFHRRKLMLLYQEHMAAMRRILQHEHAVYEEVRNNHKQMRTATNTIIMRGRQVSLSELTVYACKIRVTFILILVQYHLW